MTSLVQWLSTNAWVWLTLAVVSVLGVALSVVFYYKSKRIKDPRYIIHTDSAIEDFSTRLCKLNISYAGRKINRLTYTHIILWNDGREPISSADVAAGDPILVNLIGEGVILDCYLPVVNNPANRVSVSLLNEKQASVRFDFLDFQQGGVIEVLHTGKGSQDLSLQGTIIGAGNFALVDYYSNDDLTRYSFRGRRYNAPSLLLLGVIGAVPISLARTIAHGIHGGLTITICCAIAFFLCLMFILRRVASLPELPRGLGTMDMNGWKWNDNKKR